MESLYSKYIKERLNKKIIETDRGFATFIINGKECYIEDIYVTPEYRQSGEASKMADEITKIALNSDCSYLIGSVAPVANNSTDSLKVLLSYGFKLHSIKNELIVLVKNIQGDS